MSENNFITMIQLRDSNLHVGSYIIPLYGRKKMMNLVQAMIEGNRGMTRAELRRVIYKPNPGEEQSFRLRDSQDCSLSKLISRSRRHLKLALSGTPWSQAIDWFVYDDQGKNWSFHQIRLPVFSFPPLAAPETYADAPLENQSVAEKVHGQRPITHVKILS